MADTDRLSRQVFVRAAAVIRLNDLAAGSPEFDRHLAILDRFLPKIPDHPDDPLYVLRGVVVDLVDARLNVALADWTTLRWRLNLALRDCMVVATAQAVERYDAMTGAA